MKIRISPGMTSATPPEPADGAVERPALPDLDEELGVWLGLNDTLGHQRGLQRSDLGWVDADAGQLFRVLVKRLLHRVVFAYLAQGFRGDLGQVVGGLLGLENRRHRREGGQ